MRKRTKNLRKLIKKLRFLKFLKKGETDQKYEETDLKIWGNLSKIKRQPYMLNIGKRIQNIRKSLNNSELLRDMLEFLKKRKFLKNHFWSVSMLSRFRVEAFPCHQQTHRVTWILYKWRIPWNPFKMLGLKSRDILHLNVIIILYNNVCFTYYNFLISS